MALPIKNLKTSDIQAVLGVADVALNARNTFLNPKVVGSGLDPAYCPGTTGYDRLYNLRDAANRAGTRELRFGKFRGYNHFAINYKSGLHYNYRAIKAYTLGEIPAGKSWLSDTIHMPDGWRIMTLTDWSNILASINAAWTLSNNYASLYLKTTYNSTACAYGWVVLQGNGYTTFKQLAAGNFAMFATGDNQHPFRLGHFGLNEAAQIWVLENIRSSQPHLLRLNDNNSLVNFFNSGALTYEKTHFAQVRLVQASTDGGSYNSNDPGYVEDIDGNIYGTVKIGNYVMTSECIRTKTNYALGSLADYTNKVDTEVYEAILTPSGFIDNTRSDV